jgi:fused signal recognition particle receptor
MDTATLIILGAVALVLIAIGVMALTRTKRDEDTTALPGTAAPPRPRAALGAAIRRALGSKLDEGTWESLEDALLAADVGVAASTDIVAEVRATNPETVEEAWQALSTALKAELADRDRDLHLDGSPSVVLVVGVNGTGKTTTIAKLAHRLQNAGKSVTLGAGDTFRAAATEQLVTWGDRLGTPGGR